MSRSIIPDLKTREVWFLTGSQGLYGEETLKQVAEQSQEVARVLGASSDVPVSIVWILVIATFRALQNEYQSDLRTSLLWVAGALLLVAGVAHFAAPDGFDSIVPHVLPGSRALWTAGPSRIPKARAIASIISTPTSWSHLIISCSAA